MSAVFVRMKLCHGGENRRKRKKKKNEHCKLFFFFSACTSNCKMLIHFVQKWLYVLKWSVNNKFVTEEQLALSPNSMLLPVI